MLFEKNSKSLIHLKYRGYQKYERNVESMENTNNKFNWGSFLLGIGFLLVAYVTLHNPGSSLLSIVLLFGVAAIVKGVFELTVRSRILKVMNQQHIWAIVLGILDIILGIYLLFNLNIGLTVLPFVFAIWFIADSITGLVMTQFVKGINKPLFVLTAIVNVLGIILGVALLFNPITSALTLASLVSFYFLMTGIVYIVDAF